MPHDDCQHPRAGFVRQFTVARPVALLVIASGLAFGYVTLVQIPHMDTIRGLHSQVLTNNAPSPYQYHMFAMTWMFELLHRNLGLELAHAIALSNLCTMIFLVFANDYWCHEVVPDARPSLIGTLYLAATAPLLFPFHWYHPADFLGTGLFGLTLVCIKRGKMAPTMGLGILSAILWEKAIFMPLIFLGIHWRSMPRRRVFLLTLILAVCFLAPQAILRVYLGPRQPVLEHDWNILLDRWPRTVMLNLAFLGPAAWIVLRRWHGLPQTLRVVLWYVPLMYAAYILVTGYLWELRSFWVIMPILSSVVASAFAIGEPPG